MTVRTKLVLVLLLVCTTFVAGLWAIRQDQEDYFARIVDKRREEWRSSVDRFLTAQQRPTALTVENLADNLETVLALEFSDTARLAKALDDEALRSHGIQSVWVYGADGRFVFGHALSSAVGTLNGKAMPGVNIPALVRTSTDRMHFYLPLPAAVGPAEEAGFLEIRGTPVVAKLPDAQGAPRALGTLFAACLFGAQEVAELSLLHAEDHLFLTAPDASPEGSASPSAMFSRPQFLRDWQGRKLAQLLVRNDSRELQEVQSRNTQHLWLLLAGVLGLFILVFLWLSRSILHPLRLMIEGLHKRKLSPLALLERENSELGDLARLIQAHFEQRDELVLEMGGRVAAQQALRQSEEMLRHSQKMEAVGRLAGGVAHDFNNLLTAIIGYAELLQKRLQGQPIPLQEAKLIHQAGEQAAGLTRQLLAFSRKQLLQPKLIDLNALVGNLHRLLQRIIGEHIEIQTLPEAGASCVRADPGQIEQVIVNLGVNARDAMPRGGRLTIRTLNRSVENGGGGHNLSPGEYVLLEVTDTGAGMDEETSARIFEPFFTTKGPGKGTGLGLATVYGIVKQSGGGIEVESRVGQGSTFRISLPSVVGTPEVQEAVKSAPSRSNRTEVILVVEDEEIVRELVCEVLREEGYRVLACAGGNEALRLLAREGETIDLLISDVVMPEMNGAEVAQRVRAASPRVRVLFVSGYSEHDLEDQGLEPLSFQVLQKPFTPNVLERKVREVLEGAAPAEKG